jgi:N-methylhydantoinase A
MGGAVATAIIERETIAPGHKLQGPAIVDEWTMTTVVPPGWNCLCDEYGNLILEPSGQ